MVKPGYKQTEVGVIPEDWKIENLGDICVITAGKDLVKNQFSDIQTDRYPFPIYANGLSDAGLYGFSSFSEYQAGCVTVTARGTLGYAFARISPFCAIGRLLILNPCNNDNHFYISEFINNRVHFAVETTGVPQLTAPQISRYQIALPPKAEQQAIAEALSDVDELIGGLEKLIAKKRAIKTGTMQQLLTGKQRLPGFDGEWEVKRLGDVVDIRKGQLITIDMVILGTIPVIAGGKKPAYFHNKANREGKTITVSASGASAGYTAFHNYPIFASDCSTISEGFGYSIEYIFYQLVLRQYEIYKAQTGGAQPHIHPKDLHGR